MLVQVLQAQLIITVFLVVLLALQVGLVGQVAVQVVAEDKILLTQ